MSDDGAIPRYRRPTREMAPAVSDSHVVWCWEGEGPGARLRLHVDQVENNMTEQIDGVAKEARGEILAINKRIWYLNGGLGLLVLIVPIVLGFWLNSRLKTTEGAAPTRADVESAIRRSVEMVAARGGRRCLHATRDDEGA